MSVENPGSFEKFHAEHSSLDQQTAIDLYGDGLAAYRSTIVPEVLGGLSVDFLILSRPNEVKDREKVA